MGVESVVRNAARPVQVTRRAAGVAGSDGRFTAGSTLVATVRLHVQPVRGIQLNRGLGGDATTGDVNVFASLTDLAAAYDSTDVADPPTALGWTQLLIAPPDGAGSGPPGDRIAWRGREYEIVKERQWDDAGLVPNARFRRYVAEERGASA